MSVPHENIVITIIPDDYHIQFAGTSSDGKQVFATTELKYDANARKTTDFVVMYSWDSDGNFIDGQVTTLGIRGEYDNAIAAEIQRNLEQSVAGFTPETIRVKPCRFRHDNIDFGFIPRTDNDFTVVEMMPGNCICFLEPFDGKYDT